MEENSKGAVSPEEVSPEAVSPEVRQRKQPEMMPTAASEHFYTNIRRDESGKRVPLPPLPSDEQDIVDTSMREPRGWRRGQREYAAQHQHSTATPMAGRGDDDDDADEDGDEWGARRVTLAHALNNVLSAMLLAVQRSSALTAESEQDVSPLSVLGDGVSFPLPLLEPQASHHTHRVGHDIAAAPVDDMGSLVLHPSDLPYLKSGDTVFFVGHRSWDTPKARGPRAETVAAHDIHMCMCGVVCQAKQEFRAFADPNTPLHYVRAQWTVFEDSEGASNYFQRGWRTLSGNVSPGVGESALDLSAFDELKFPRIEKRKHGSDALVCLYTNVDPVEVTSFRGIALTSIVVANILVNSVVVTLQLAHREKQAVALAPAYEALITTVLARARTWTGRVNPGLELQNVKPYLQLFRQQLMELWQEKSQELFLADKQHFKKSLGALNRRLAAQAAQAARHAKGMGALLQASDADARDEMDALNTTHRVDAAPACHVCEQALDVMKCCGGCRAFAYCGAVCQREHWTRGKHKRECSREFELLDDFSRKRRYYRARTKESTPIQKF